MTAAVMLVKALGGSWNVSALPSAEEGNSAGRARCEPTVTQNMWEEQPPALIRQYTNGQ
jgi:hypothetical protein